MLRKPSLLTQLAQWVTSLHPAQFWLAVVLASVLPISVGTVAFLHLLQVVEFPSCRTSAWTAESTSARLHCAEQLAKKQTFDGLKSAIEIANSIPGDDPYRKNSDRFIDQWSRDLLRLAEGAFQAGELERAEEMVRAIPLQSEIQPQAEKQLTSWKAFWRQAESIYADAQQSIADQRWSEALANARKLLYLGNTYWETTKYQELAEELRLAKEAEASQKAEKAKKEKEAKQSVPDLAAQWKRKQDLEMADHLRKAYALAKMNSSDSLREAIVEAQMVLTDAPQYAEAQQAIATWRQQVEVLEDRPYLTRAMNLAERGDRDSLQAAISEASLIPPGRALYGEARNRIEQWMLQVNQLQISIEAPAQIPPPAPSVSSPAQPPKPELLPVDQSADQRPAPLPIDPIPR